MFIRTENPADNSNLLYFFWIYRKDIGICISASRAELGKGENRFEPSVSRIWQKQNVLAYVYDILYICFSLYYLYLVCNRAPTHGGLGCRGAAPCHECAPSLYKKSEQAMYSLLRHESKDHVLIPNAHPANLSL